MTSNLFDSNYLNDFEVDLLFEMYFIQYSLL